MGLVKQISRKIITQPRQFPNRDTLNPIQAKFLDEKCIQVDENDEPIGSITKEDCHFNGKAIFMFVDC